MSWVLSFIITSLLFSNPGSFSIYSNENLIAGNTPQLVVLTPQTVLQGDETERFEQTYPLSANGKLSINNVNGSITIDTWDRNEVKLEAVKIADSKERLSQVEIKVDSKPDSLKIETEYGSWKNGNRSWNCSGYCRLEVQYKLTVPRNAVLNEIETVNGSVTITNASNYTKASAVNGTVKASNLRGTAYIDTVNGVSEVDFDSLNSDSKIKLSTVNGKVNLVIPSDADATIKADTVNGSISNEFGLPVRKGKYIGRDLFGKLGNGTVKIDLDSVNGGLNIRRKSDGKNIKPVTNLLNMKEDADDEDDEDSVDDVSTVTVQKMNKDIAKAVKESTKVSIAESVKIAEQAPKMAADAMRETNRVMMENQKEIQRAQRDAIRVNRDAMRATQDALRATQSAFRWNFSNNFDFGDSRIEEKTDTFQVKGTPKVTVNSKYCPVTVKGWDRPEVKYRITKFVRGGFQPNVNVSVSHTESEVMINADLEVQKIKTTGESAAANVDFDIKMLPANVVKVEVFVPKKSNLRILSDKEIRIDGVTGNIDLTGNDGPINVRDSEGRLKITADEALIRVIGFNGEVDSRTTNGENFFEGDFTKFFARNEVGKLVLTLPEDANVNIQANTKINTEGFDLKEFNGDERNRKIGEGGTVYTLQVTEGEILVRNANLLKTTN
ncbi:MAG: hypothetical protein K1X72_03710 [Pyrinomonadaceae bacterium]|nr:hypothetical protein [Pyrinomonadaceae bacterium]